ncbi:hypothetical protein C2G38_2183859 [Gigaspora rosea]|uniref:Uncharacterized protein n=1 Tax=Gigaspora rosea TaxID=44941 RepID=A0A397VHC7_9GLOM|nr:hypothetical protein C2G38_2183859 [Gigaspora rosea]
MPLMIGKIKAEITTKFNSRDAKYVTEAQNIISMINNLTEEYNEIKRVLETYHNNFNQIATEFETISRTIKTLQSEINQCYSLIQSMSRRGSDQQKRNTRNLTFDRMCSRIEDRIQDFGGKIKVATIKNFYNNNNSTYNSSTLNDIGKWLDDVE